jgi:chromate reductase, NAD(P)H dehydrogenase (quinone)
MNLLALSASLRRESTNGMLLRAAALLAPDFKVDFFGPELAAIPAFSPDLDPVGAVAAPAVADLRHRIARADAVLISSPEYAHGVPGAFKNALDWIVSSGELTDKPTLVWMASPSGAERARAALVPTLRVLGARLVADLSLRVVRTHFAADGSVADPELRAALLAGLEGLRAAPWTPAAPGGSA